MVNIVYNFTVILLSCVFLVNEKQSKFVEIPMFFCTYKLSDNSEMFIFQRFAMQFLMKCDIMKKRIPLRRNER